MSAYRRHHYVPQWYQKRFLQSGTSENVLHYLSLKPIVITDGIGRRRELPPKRRRPIRQCFVEEDLYTIQFGPILSTAIERLLFGEIDRRGAEAAAFWRDFAHPSVDADALEGLLLYMSTQKLRTPKGIAWLAEQVQSSDRNQLLRLMVELRRLKCAVWSECVWQIADAHDSETKFLVTDHPVTVYNRACGPRNRTWCGETNDPDIRLHGTHTLFPLDLERVLILTNLSWARDPYQSATKLRPNPAYLRDSFFNFLEVQTHRCEATRSFRT